MDTLKIVLELRLKGLSSASKICRRLTSLPIRTPFMLGLIDCERVYFLTVNSNR